eukprot:c4924_g1_i1.p1 GENE.c4924_g1_i1~~c4924_g1_i1.p1  ORF type:complete len:149 (+),score=22.74 c4924_g1_i1:44-490(+)
MKKSLLSLQLEAEPDRPASPPETPPPTTPIDEDNNKSLNSSGLSDSPPASSTTLIRQRYYSMLNVVPAVPVAVPPSPNRMPQQTIALSAPLAIPTNNSSLTSDNTSMWSKTLLSMSLQPFVPPHELILREQRENDFEQRPHRHDRVHV